MTGSTCPIWHNAAAQRQQEISESIPDNYRLSKELLDGHNSIDLPRRCGLLSVRELNITESRAVDLLALIEKRTYTAVEVATAFCKRAAIAHQATNCLAVIMFENALKQAQELDCYMDKYGKTKGPLHGLPISVKEHIFLEGTVATSGLMAWKDLSSPADALISKIFREAGAVFHVKTTNPQTLMALETHSNLFGRTTNPYNNTLTCGGSSGGEAALIAMRGSVLGIGSDIGGSIRIPSAFCGGYGLKPSIARIPHSGMSGMHSGMQNIIGCVGPMANCIEDLRLFCDVALAYQPWNYEPSLIEIPWRHTSKKELPKKLTFGVMWHDGVVTPHPPVARVLEQTVDSLRRAGHRIVDWDPKYHSPLVKWINRAYFLDGAQEYRQMLDSNDPPVPVIKWLLDTEGGERCTVEETWKVNIERDQLQTLYAAQWRAAGIDAILCPVNPSVASAHDESTYWGYTAAFNALDLPGTVFPASTVKATDTWKSVGLSGNAVPMTEKDAEYRRYFDQGGPYKYRDAPVSLQLIGRRLQEEKLLAMTELVEGVLRDEKSEACDETTPIHLVNRKESQPTILQSPGQRFA
ncbi:hypothetical protein MBLNU459_g4217t1 [Dothideomycetes sp. NU459]